MPNKPAKNSDPGLRGRAIHQRLVEVEWCIERMLEAKAEGQEACGNELRAALRAEFPDTVSNQVKAAKRIAAAKKAVNALMGERKESLRAVVYTRLEELFAGALTEDDRREAREVLKDLVKTFGLADAEKTELEIGEKARAAILGDYTVKISDKELDEACDVSE